MNYKIRPDSGRDCRNKIVTLQEKLIRENNRCHDLETKLSVQADDIKRKRELIEELGELIMAEKGFTTNEEYVEWYLKNRNVSQN